MSDNVNADPLLLFGSILLLLIIWLAIVGYALVSLFIPLHPTDDEKHALASFVLQEVAP